jgi:hypothetical protein
MTSRRILHPAIPSPEPEAAFDLEAFADRMHLGDAVARCAYEVFQSHGSAPNLEVEESWTRAESERLNEYVSGRRAA